MNTLTRISGLLIAQLLVLSDTAFSQGSLTPPGPPAATMKTLQQIEPRTDLQATPAPASVDTTNGSYHFIINQPGSYFLSANLDVTKANGIQINAAGVTLDLNGFQIVRTSGTGGNGLEISAISSRASVRNGSIKGFAYGVRTLAGTTTAQGCAFRDLAASGCTTAGISVSTGAILESCRAENNSGTYGIDAGAGSSLTNCTAIKNTVTYAIQVGRGSSLANCTALFNTGGYGIYADPSSSLTNCAANGNDVKYGIFALEGCSLSNCSASENTGSGSTSAGIGTHYGCTITHCSAWNNSSTAPSSETTGMGFDVGGLSTIQNCTAHNNEGAGIGLEGNTVARDNSCTTNGFNGDASGIFCVSSDNRIEKNHVADNDRGIHVASKGNLIVQNSASGNGVNYEIVADNRYGVIIDLAASGTAAVSGNSAAGTLTTTTNPWANFAY